VICRDFLAKVHGFNHHKWLFNGNITNNGYIYDISWESSVIIMGYFMGYASHKEWSFHELFNFFLADIMGHIATNYKHL